MANQEQVDQIKQGVDDWYRWRMEHPFESIDLRDADLSSANLRDAILRNVDLSNANLSSAKLRDADLLDANLSGADLSNADLMDACLINTNLCSANLRDADLNGTDLSGADLSNADLSSANLTNVILAGAHLTNVILAGAHLHNANLRGANFRGADFSNAYLGGANLEYANLENANLKCAVIEGTQFGDRDLRVIKGLETVVHRSPSPLSITSIYKSQGDIPEAFVLGTGVPKSFLEYMKPLASKSIEYYTCFISYSSHNEPFAKRLHADLQQSGVSCWFAPEDMKIGDKIRPRIDETIRKYDKLLLIFSQNSIASNWIAYEVEKALDKEPQGIANVLFPIRIDDTILTCNTSWAQDIKQTRHIGDFSHWKDHDTYQQAFSRLLRDLKAESST